MSIPAKRQHEETAVVNQVVVESGAAKQPQQQHVGVGVGVGVGVMESATGNVFGGEAESRPAKLARRSDEKPELFSIGAYSSSKPGRDGGGEALVVGDNSGISSKEAPVPQLKIKVRGEFGGVDRMDLERKASVGKEYAEAAKEVLGTRVDAMKGEEQLQLQQGGTTTTTTTTMTTATATTAGEGGVGGQEFADVSRGDVNSEGLRKKSPRESEGKGGLLVGKDAPTAMEVKRDDLKEKDKKEENRIDGKQDVALQPHPHSDFLSEKEKEETMERDKGEKEKERVRERSRDREKEAVIRSKREKERDRDSHRREEREDSLVEKLDKGEGKAMKIDAETETTDRKTVVEDRRLVEKEGRVRDRDRDEEKDEEGEGEKRKKRGREQEKDRDAMDTEGAGGGEKEKDGAQHGYGLQQRKRMLRPRGQSNPANRDSRSRFRPKDIEGTQGRSESTSIIYRVGEGMPELAKLRKEYVETRERNSSANELGPTVEIRIPAELATTTNRQIRGSQLWGTDIYTDDSDIVAVMMHTGYFSPSASPPPNTISELRATIRILESQPMYTSTLRNSLRSRAWGGESGCSYSIERCRIVKQQGGGFVELEPCLTRNPQVAPTLAPAASERTVTTRAASSSAYRQQRFMQEVTIQYNLCNEPWAKYHMSIVADRGLKKSQFTSARLKKGEVLYVETQDLRFELAYDGERTTCNGATTATSSVPQGTSGTEKGKEKWGSTERALAVSEKEPILHIHNGEKSHGNHPSNGQTGAHHSHSGLHHSGEVHECYRWSKCKRPLSLSSMKKKGVPLPEEFVEVLEEGLTWEEIQWAPTSVWIRGTEYHLTRAQFFSFDKDDAKE